MPLNGVAHVHATFNNTIITITDTGRQRHLLGERRQGRLQGLAQEHARSPRRWRPRTPRKEAIEPRACAGRGVGEGSRRRPRSGDPRRSQAAGLEITAIRDVTPIPHNGCRPPKRRRV